MVGSRMFRTLFAGLSLVVFVLTAGLNAYAQTSGMSEVALFQKAQNSGLFSDYVAYLHEYPNGTFSEAARFEMQWALKSAQDAQAGITFETPLLSANPDLNGKSIEDLISGTPLFAPFEGLPEALWKDAPCGSCHAWTKEALCDQGLTYTGIKESKALDRQHPYGGLLKSALRTFAIEGCK